MIPSRLVDWTLSAVHTRFDGQGLFDDQELAEQIDELLFSIAGHVSTRLPLADTSTADLFVA